MPEGEWRTLPLFADGRMSEVHPRAERRQLKRDPLDLVLHVYWSAGVEAHALGALARGIQYPDQRRALHKLQRLEEQRKALAARLLETVWRVRLPGSSIADGEHNLPLAA